MIDGEECWFDAALFQYHPKNSKELLQWHNYNNLSVVMLGNDAQVPQKFYQADLEEFIENKKANPGKFEDM